MGNLQVRFLEGWASAMAPGYSTFRDRTVQIFLQSQTHADVVVWAGHCRIKAERLVILSDRIVKSALVHENVSIIVMDSPLVRLESKKE